MTTATADPPAAETITNNGRSARATLDGFPAPGAPAAIHGWIVSWELSGGKIPYHALKDALRLSGLDPAVARAMLPQNAFKRAARTLQDDRIIRPVGTDGVTMRFQFTAEHKLATGIEYSRETVMSLNLENGDIDSDRGDLTAAARAAFDEALATRTTADVTAIIQRLFVDRKAVSRDLIPVNKRGVYFVRKEEGAFVDRIEAFVGNVGGQLLRLPVAAGTPAGDRQVKAATANRMADLIADLEAATDAFGADTTERALVNASERVKLIRHKIVSYQAYLDDEKGKLETSLAGATAKLREKIQEIGRLREAAQADAG